MEHEEFARSFMEGFWKSGFNKAKEQRPGVKIDRWVPGIGYCSEKEHDDFLKSKRQND